MIDLHGVIVPLLTPLTAHGGLDAAGLARLVERQLRAGVHGFFAAGTTGEFLALPAQTRIRAFETVCAAAGEAVPVVAGVSAASLEDILDYAEAAAACGAVAVSLLPPPYFPLTEAELGDFYAAALERLPLPAVLYNFPALSGKWITPALAERFAKHPKVIGMKDSSGDTGYFYGLLPSCRSEKFRLLIGSDVRMAEAFARGADGAVPGIANVMPELCVQIYEATRRGDREAALAAQLQVTHAIEPFASGASSWLDMIRWMKRCLHEVGVCEPHLAPVFGAARHGVPVAAGMAKSS